MSNVYDLKKRFNHRWKTDPLFLKEFDYDHPRWSNVPDDLKWAAPLVVAQEKPEVIEAQERVRAKAHATVERERRQTRLNAFKKLSET